jgi:hypothetical protein
MNRVRMCYPRPTPPKWRDLQRKTATLVGTAGASRQRFQTRS